MLQVLQVIMDVISRIFSDASRLLMLLYTSIATLVKTKCVQVLSQPTWFVNPANIRDIVRTYKPPQKYIFRTFVRKCARSIMRANCIASLCGVLHPCLETLGLDLTMHDF